MAKTTYDVVPGQQTGMAVKDGWYVREIDGLTRIINRRYETWLEAKAVADRLTELDAEHPGS